MMLLLLWACGDAPTPQVDEAHQFVEALRAQDPARCAELSDPELRAHCQNAAHAPCEGIDAGPWRDECLFSRGEAALAAGDHPRALADCRASGPFSTECLTHLFKAELEPRIKALPKDFSFAEPTAEARALAESYGDWSPPWGWWWRSLHAASTPLDRAHCEPLESQDRRACQREAVAVLRIAWSKALGDRPRELCSLAPEELRAVVAGDPELDWRPNPDLDAVVAEERARRCR